MRIPSTTVVLALLVSTSGCVYVDDPVNDPIVVVVHHHAPEIRYFSLLAAPGATASNYGAAPITPYLDNGNFQIQWEVATEGAYQIDMYVSNDPYLDPEDPWARDDIHFKQSYRGISDYVVLDAVTMNCRFTTDNILSCGRISYENPGRDITPFLTRLPKPGYIILRACDDSMQDCTTMALSVEFH